MKRSQGIHNATSFHCVCVCVCADMIESYVPGTTPEEPLHKVLALARDYVVKLRVTSLQPPAKVRHERGEVGWGKGTDSERDGVCVCVCVRVCACGESWVEQEE